MLLLAAEENLNNEILRGLIRRKAGLEIVRLQDCGLLGADDPSVLAWAAQESRILLTHDRATMPDFAFERVRAGLPMPGLFVASDRSPIGRAIEDILLLSDSSEPHEWEGVVLYIPL